MKTIIRLFFFLVFCVLTDLLPQANAQNCQAIIPVLDSATPAWNPADSIFDLCLGDTLFLAAHAEYPQNNLNYFQSDAFSTFEWIWGDGASSTGQTSAYAYEEPGGYFISLVVRDSTGCTNEEPFVLKVRVHGPPNSQFIYFPETPAYCPGTDLVLYPFLTPDTLDFDFLVNDDPIALPDGTGEAYRSVIHVAGFSPSDTISDASQLEGICAILEHSYMRDLDIRLICPDSTEVPLLGFAGQTGGQVFLGVPFENDEGGNPIPGQGFTYCWRDDASNPPMINYANSFEPDTLPAGDYQPSEPLSNLIGCPLNGDWTLQIEDLWGIDNGFLFFWELELSGALLAENNLSDTSFYSNVGGLQWQNDSTIQNIVGDTIYTQPTPDHIFHLTVTDEQGCEYPFTHTIENILPAGSPVCQPCDSLIADTGASDTLTLNCLSATFELGGPETTLGAYLEYEWTTVDGTIIFGADQPFCEINTPGTYFLTVSNVITGCESTDSVLVLQSIEAPIADAGMEVLEQCSQGTYTLDGSGSSSGPEFIYEWSATTGNGTILADGMTLFPLVSGSGTYALQVTNTINGCVASDLVEVTLSPDLILNFDIQAPNCDQADGSATVLLLPGTPPATFEWSNGQTDATATGLAQGWYSVTVTTADCSAEEDIFVDEDLSCKVVIKGTVFDDSFNMDCAEDSFTIPVECIMLHLLPADIYTYTDENGEYEFLADAGNHTIEYIDEDVYSLLCPGSGSIELSLSTPGMVSEGNHFYTKKSPIDNLCLNLLSFSVRPGFDKDYTYTICNLGYQSSTATAEFVHDPLLEDVNLSTIADSYDPNTQTATWFFPEIASGACVDLSFTLYVPPTVELGTVITTSASVIPIDGDIFPYNNQQTWVQVVTGSYDPNDKTTLTGENQFGGAIFSPQDSVIDYQIRFQNTGTDTAFTVVIRDTLDANLDVETIRPGISSHDMQVQFEGNNVLIFMFENILLPDSTTNLEGSNGFVTFSIRPRPGLEIGDEIRNRAAIFFDFNEPIITNETVHILSEPSGLAPISVKQNPYELFPNPTSGYVELKGLAGAELGQVLLLNNLGQLVSNLSTQGNRVELPALPSGLYYLYFQVGGEWFSGKVVVSQ